LDFRDDFGRPICAVSNVPHEALDLARDPHCIRCKKFKPIRQGFREDFFGDELLCR
jgi:hypothetical protein